MFNSPLLEIALGLVFILLIYSLLVTSINETIASVFATRASMLRRAILVNMLSDTPKMSRMQSIYQGVISFFKELVHYKTPKSDSDIVSLGEMFFDHPLIKTNGSSRIFPHPSYISANNFSAVMCDLLRNEFAFRIDEIAVYYMLGNNNVKTIDEAKQHIKAKSEMKKFRLLLRYYDNLYVTNNLEVPQLSISKETSQLLQMFAKKCVQINQFELNLQSWFNDTMNRVSGWYKRQTQLMLFIIGFILAMLLNVDIIQISTKLSTDKDAREKVVAIASQVYDNYQNDPRLIRTKNEDGVETINNSGIYLLHNLNIFKEYQANLDNTTRNLKNDINKSDKIFAIGWGDFGGKDNYFSRVGYVLQKTFTKAKKFGAFLIFAFAVSLGAPFWFDLLSKVVNLRGAGKKE